MRHRDWLKRMHALTERLQLYTHARVTWNVDTEGSVFFEFANPSYGKSGPIDPDQIAELGTDDAAHSVLMMALICRISAFRPR